jgi:hypothetical protein
MRTALSSVLALVACLWAASCATVFNSPVKTIAVHTTEATRVTIDDRLTETVEGDDWLYVERGPRTLAVHVENTQADTTLYLAPRNSAAYYWNLYFNYGIGMLVERRAPKRYTYPSRLYVDSDGSVSTRKADGYDFVRRRRPQFFALRFSLPVINYRRFKPGGHPYRNTFNNWGATVGMEYGYTADHSVVVTLGGLAGSFFSTGPVASGTGYFYDTFETASSLYTTLTHQTRVHKYFLVGAGLSYGVHRWSQTVDSYLSRPDGGRDASVFSQKFSERHTSLGLAFNGYYTAGKNFQVGLVYRPSYYRFGAAAPWVYEQTLSLDLLWTGML